MIGSRDTKVSDLLRTYKSFLKDSFIKWSEREKRLTFLDSGSARCTSFINFGGTSLMYWSLCWQKFYGNLTFDDLTWSQTSNSNTNSKYLYCISLKNTWLLHKSNSANKVSITRRYHSFLLPVKWNHSDYYWLKT